MPVEISAEEFFDLPDGESDAALIGRPKTKDADLRFEAAKKRLAERVGKLFEKQRKNAHSKNV